MSRSRSSCSLTLFGVCRAGEPPRLPDDPDMYALISNSTRDVESLAAALWDTHDIRGDMQADTMMTAARAEPEGAEGGDAITGRHA